VEPPAPPPTVSALLARIEAAFPPLQPLHSLADADAVDTAHGSLKATHAVNLPPTDAELLRFGWGLPHLDPHSWRAYLPYFLAHAVRNAGAGESLVVEWTLQTVRPPDRTVPRLAALTPAQRDAVVGVLEFLAHDASSAFREFALQVLGEFRLVDPTRSP
jgi:hypothetical protein